MSKSALGTAEGAKGRAGQRDEPRGVGTVGNGDTQSLRHALSRSKVQCPLDGHRDC